MAANVVSVQPSRTYSRYWVLRIAPGRYYQSGGFTVNAGQVSVGNIYSRRRSSTSVDRVHAVVLVLVRLRRGDWRVLLVNASNQVLIRTSAIFFSDADLKGLANDLACEFRKEDFRSYRKLDEHYPGSLGHKWERFPTLTGFVLGLAIVAVVLLVVLLIHA